MDLYSKESADDGTSGLTLPPPSMPKTMAEMWNQQLSWYLHDMPELESATEQH